MTIQEEIESLKSLLEVCSKDWFTNNKYFENQIPILSHYLCCVTNGDKVKAMSILLRLLKLLVDTTYSEIYHE